MARRIRAEAPSRGKLSVVVFGYGNPSRGDDALGPALLERIAQAVPLHPEWPALTLIEDFQLQIEHSLDLESQDIALFIDADVGCMPPCVLEALTPEQDTSYTTHAMTPNAVLAVYEKVQGARPPPAFVLRIRGESFGLGEGMSGSGEAHLAAAEQVAFRFLAQPAAFYEARIPGA